VKVPVSLIDDSRASDTAAAVAATMSAAASLVLCREVAQKFNVLTVTEVDFDSMLGDCKFDHWFRENLRCGQATFLKLVDVIQSRMQPFCRYCLWCQIGQIALMHISDGTCAQHFHHTTLQAPCWGPLAGVPTSCDGSWGQ